MTDYLPLLSRAVANLENNPEARRKVYDRARQALLAQLRAMNPPLAEAEITRERLALEEAIRRLDQQAARPEAGAVPSAPPPQGAAPQPRTPPSPRPPAPRPPAAAGTPPVSPASRAPQAAPGVPVPPAPGREQPAAPPSGSRVVRDAVEGVRPLGPAAADAARSARGVAGETGDFDEPAIVPGADPRARFGRDDDRALVNDLQGRGGRRGTIDYAKADAKKAMKAKLIVGGIVGGLLGVAIFIGYVHRDRILASLGIGSPPARTVQQPSSAPPGQDRIQQAPQTKSGAQPNVPAAAVAQRAVLYEENPGSNEQQLQTFVGTAVWRTETINPGPGRPPELGLRVDVEIPDRKMTVTISMRRNPDQTLPASHMIEVQFRTPGDPFGGVANLPGIRAKTTETAQGAPLVGLVVRVMPGFFMVGLSAIDADREQNLSLLRERGWLDIPFVYNNGRRSVLVVEKGTPGERAVNEVIAAWGG
jgi:hypothetical protein